MKYFKHFFKAIFYVLIATISMAIPLESMAQGATDITTSQGAAPHLSDLKMMDGVDISLLTCSPGNQVWSLYGHTAIRYTDRFNHIDLVINYGIFSLRKRILFSVSSLAAPITRWG